MINRVIQIDKQPLIYCKDCGKRNTWERDINRDCKTDDGKITNFAYRCKTKYCNGKDLRTYEPELT